MVNTLHCMVDIILFVIFFVFCVLLPFFHFCASRYHFPKIKKLVLYFSAFMLVLLFLSLYPFSWVISAFLFNLFCFITDFPIKWFFMVILWKLLGEYKNQKRKKKPTVELLTCVLFTMCMKR